MLHGYGIRISVRRGVLVIWGRFKTEPEEIRLYPGDLQLPSRIILHDSKASLSTDAMAWLVKQGMTLVNVDYKGEALSLVGGMGEGARAHALAQILASKDPQMRIKIGRLLISEKTREQYHTLEETLGIREPHLTRTLQEIKRATELENLLQIEARAASA